MAQETITIAALAQRTEWIAGKHFTVIAATAGFSVELDGRNRRAVAVGSKISNEPFDRISFFETAGAANTITFDAGAEEYQGDVQSIQKVSRTYAYGNAGNYSFPTVKKAKVNISGWAYDSAVAPTNLVSEGILVSGQNNGRRRKQITVQNTTNGANTRDLLLFDTGGRPFLRVKANDIPYTWETDADIYFMGSGADIVSGAVIINEIFYQDV